MRLKKINPPREFRVGKKRDISIVQSGQLFLENNEQLLLESGGCFHAVTKKEWGFYLTESVSQRVLEAGFRVGIMQNEAGRSYVVLVESEKVPSFQLYCDAEKQEVRWIT